MRIKWYESPNGKTFRDYALAGSGEFPDDDIPSGLIQIDPYETNEPPVFFGHYWLTNERPEILALNVACLDYSVAKGGALCAYRWDGESQLSNENFVTVEANR